MTVAICLCDRGGMLFNNRRQSKDRNQILDLLSLASGEKIYINAFSEKLFSDSGANFEVVENPLESGGFAFVENLHISPYIDRINKLIIYRWNRRYPADFSVDISPSDAGMSLSESVDFEGYSHEKITREVWIK